MLCAMREQGGHITGTAADFEHGIVTADVGGLQDASLGQRRKHVFSAWQRDFHVGISVSTAGRRYEIFPANCVQRIEYTLEMDTSGTDLVFNHVGACGTHGICFIGS